MRDTTEEEFLEMFRQSPDLKKLFILKALTKELPEKFEMSSFSEEEAGIILQLSNPHKETFEMGAPGVVWSIKGQRARLVYDAKNLREQTKERFEQIVEQDNK